MIRQPSWVFPSTSATWHLLVIHLTVPNPGRLAAASRHSKKKNALALLPNPKRPGSSPLCPLTIWTSMNFQCTNASSVLSDLDHSLIHSPSLPQTLLASNSVVAASSPGGTEQCRSCSSTPLPSLVSSHSDNPPEVISIAKPGSLPTIILNRLATLLPAIAAPFLVALLLRSLRMGPPSAPNSNRHSTTCSNHSLILDPTDPCCCGRIHN